MAAINWKTYDTGEIVTEIRQNRRYKLASPSTVTGAPSLAMQSATQFAIVYIYVDDVKISTPLTISGTAKTPITINGQTPSKEELLTLSIEIGGIGSGEVIYTTDEPNGSLSSPFASTSERDAWAAANPGELVVGISEAYTTLNGVPIRQVSAGPGATAWTDAPAATRSGSRSIGIGDSIMSGGYTGQGWYEYLCHISGGKFTRVKNSAIGGQNSTQLRNRFVSDVMAYNSAKVFINSCTNDIILGVSIPTYMDNLLFMARTAKNDGRRVIFILPPPCSNGTYAPSYGGYAAAMRECADIVGCECYDIFEPIRDPATGGYISGTCLVDNIHPTPQSHLVVAQYAAWLIPGICENAPLATASNDAKNLIQNALMLTDTNADGYPDGWTEIGGGAATMSLVAQSDIVGKWIKFARPTGASVSSTAGYVISSGWSPGDKIKVWHRFKCIGVMAGNGLPVVNFKLSGSPDVYTSGATYCRADVSGIGYEEFTIPAGTTAVRMQVGIGPYTPDGASGGGDFYFGQPFVLNASKIGVA